jgi:hypothetical protein
VVNYYGTLIPLGTIDFYPNFGHSQPRCEGLNYWKFSCNHSRAIYLFIWSISNRGKFKTYLKLKGEPGYMNPVNEHIEVESPAEMGYYADTIKFPDENLKIHRNYYLKTNGCEPWK